MSKPDTIIVSQTVYRIFLEEMGIIHWLTLDKIAEPWRKFKLRATSRQASALTRIHPRRSP